MTGPNDPRPGRWDSALRTGGTRDMGAGPAPTPSRPPPAEDPFDLLRPRNIYAVVLMTAVLFLAVTAGGWLSQSSGPPAAAPTGPPAASTPSPTATPTPPSTPPAKPTPEPSPSPPAAATPIPSAAPTPSATSTPTPTVAQLAAAYLKAATVINKANGASLATWDRSARTLTEAKRLAKAYAAAELPFIRAVQRIPWYGDYKALARRVLTPDNQRYVSCGLAMASTTWAAYNVSWNEADAANRQAAAASNELRIALGLPPVPLLGR